MSTHQSAKNRRNSRSKKLNVGTPEKPRVSIFRSNKHIYVQAIDDTVGKIIASSSTLNAESKASKTELSKTVGENFGDLLKDKKIERIVFDRNGFKFHGRIKALAEAIKSKGVKF